MPFLEFFSCSSGGFCLLSFWKSIIIDTDSFACREQDYKRYWKKRGIRWTGKLL